MAWELRLLRVGAFQKRSVPGRRLIEILHEASSEHHQLEQASFLLRAVLCKSQRKAWIGRAQSERYVHWMQAARRRRLR